MACSNDGGILAKDQPSILDTSAAFRIFRRGTVPLNNQILLATVTGGMTTTMTDEKLARLRTHRNNITRYQRLLKTKLAKHERQFIERRLSEEQSDFERLSGGTFPSRLRSQLQKWQHPAT
jgi:hypothetical protein